MRGCGVRERVKTVLLRAGGPAAGLRGAAVPFRA